MNTHLVKMFIALLMPYAIATAEQLNNQDWITVPIEIPYILLEEAVIDIGNLEDEQSILSQSELRQLHYPVDTPDMRVIDNEAHSINTQTVNHLIQPIALVGVDRISMDWLEVHSPTLVEYQAMVWVAKANNEHELLPIKTLLPDVMVIALPAYLFVEQLGITGYPVLLLPVNNDVTE